MNYAHEANFKRNLTFKINPINNTIQGVTQKKMSLEDFLECARRFKSSGGKIICLAIYQENTDDNIYT